MPQTNLIPASIERFLELTSDRERTIASNMANVDTPGYKTKDINFHSEMMRAEGAAGQANFSPAVEQVSGLLDRADGNNVDIDRESLMLAQSQLQYQIGIQLIKGQFHQLITAINGGN